MSIVWAVNQLFADPAAAAKRRYYALVEAEEFYGWQHIAKRTAALYNTVVNERRATEW
jgi:glycosyltransferase involved in cell wall biosynthesis